MLGLRMVTMVKLCKGDEESSMPYCGQDIYRMSKLKASEGNCLFQCYKKQRIHKAILLFLRIVVSLLS